MSGKRSKRLKKIAKKTFFGKFQIANKRVRFSQFFKVMKKAYKRHKPMAELCSFNFNI